MRAASVAAVLLAAAITIESPVCSVDKRYSSKFALAVECVAFASSGVPRRLHWATHSAPAGKAVIAEHDRNQEQEGYLQCPMAQV